MSIHTINKVKGWVKRFLPFYLFTFLPLNALAQEQPQRTYTAEHPLIYEDVWDLWPYCFLNEKGEPDGFNVELIKLIFKELGIPYTIKLTSRQEAFNDLKAGKSDLTMALSAGYHDEYGQYGQNTITLFTQSVATPKSKDIEIYNFKDLGKHKVIVNDNSLAHRLMGDFGSALIFFATFLVIAFMRSGSIATVLLAVTSAAMAGTLVLSIKPHVAQRFATWGHVWEDVSGAGYQQTRALSAAASGGLFGQGAGCGWLKNIFAANTDMVFGMLCEELGLIVALCAMLAIIALAIFTVKNAAQGRSSYYVIAGCATVTLMLVQMSLNVFGALDILPFTGVTFPFVSKGGSSMLSCWMLLAYIKAADTRRGASFVVRLPSRKKKEAQA